MRTVTFYENAEDDALKFAAVVSRCHGQWVFCRDKKDDAWKIPGGNRRNGENIEETARRELYEGLGAAGFRLLPVCVCGVREESGDETLGMLYFAEVQEFFNTLGFEAGRIGCFGVLPENLANPDVQPALLERVSEMYGPGQTP